MGRARRTPHGGRSRWRRLVSTRCGSAKPTDSTRSPCSAISRPDDPCRARGGHSSRVLTFSRPGGHDRGRPGLRVVGEVHPRSRCLRAAGRHRLARGALRPPVGPYPRDHRRVPEGVDTTEARVPGGDVPGSVPWRRGRRGPPTEADRPPCALGNSDLRCGARAQERGARRGVRRGVDPALLRSRQRLRVG